MKNLILVALSCLILTSCVSGKRLMEISPFSEKSSALPDPDRVNLWPVVYHNQDTTSVMWPLMDFDQDGFAIRPIIAKDEADWSLLWPLSGWNTDTGRGWFLNSYFDTDEYFGIFPLMHVNEDWGFAGTAYWGKETFGVFPLLHVEDDCGALTTMYWNRGDFGFFPFFHVGKNFKYFGPFFYGDKGLGAFPAYWYWSEGPDEWAHLAALGLIGAARDGDQYSNWALPLWLNTSDDDDRFQMLLPLYMYGKDGDSGFFATALGGRAWDGDDGSTLLPFYWSQSDDDVSRRCLFPFYYSGREPGRSVTASPLFAHKREGSSSSLWLFPSWWSSQKPGESSSMLLPLWYNHERANKHRNALFPFYYYDRSGDEAYLQTLLGNWSQDGDAGSFNIYPLWWSSHSDDSEMQSLLPFYWYKRWDKQHALVTPLGGYGWHQTDDNYFVNVLGPLFHHHRSADDRHSLTAFLWPLYTSWRNDNVSQQVIPLLFDRRKSPNSTSIKTLAYLGQYYKEADSRSWMLWPLAMGSNRDELPNPMYHLNLFAAHDRNDGYTYRFTPLAQFSRHHERTRSWVLPFYYAETSPTETDLDFLLWTANYHESATGNSWRFWPLYSSTGELQRPDPLYWLTLAGRRHYRDVSSWYVTPLLGSWSDANEHYGWAAPFAWWYDTSDSTGVHWLAGSGGVHSDADGSAWYQWPLISHSNKRGKMQPWQYLHLFRSHMNEDDFHIGITPFIGYERDDDERFAYIFPLMWNYKDSGSTDFYSLGGLQNFSTSESNWAFRLTPLASFSTSRRSEDWLYPLHLLNVRSYTSPMRHDFRLNYLLFGRMWNRKTVGDSFDSGYLSKHRTIESSGSSFFPLYKRSHKVYRALKPDVLTDEEFHKLSRWWQVHRQKRHYLKAPPDAEVIAILDAHDTAVPDHGIEGIARAITSFMQANSEEYDEKEFLSLLAWYHRKHKDVDLKLLLGAINYEHDEKKDRSHFSILKYLYRRTREGKEIRRTFFPFFTWDSGESSSNFSFLWRIWHYRNDNGDKSGHILFIPWG